MAVPVRVTVKVAFFVPLLPSLMVILLMARVGKGTVSSLVVKLPIARVPVNPVTSMMASLLALNPAVPSLIATKVRLPKVN